jgi:hypothetical protein
MLSREIVMRLNSFADYLPVHEPKLPPATAAGPDESHPIRSRTQRVAVQNHRMTLAQIHRLAAKLHMFPGDRGWPSPWWRSNPQVIAKITNFRGFANRNSAAALLEVQDRAMEPAAAALYLGLWLAHLLHLAST